MAANRILIVRLRNLLDGPTGILQGVTKVGALAAEKTLQHIERIREERLRELLDDKELGVPAGITVPATRTVTAVDDINGVNSIEQTGFGRLLDLWNQAVPNPPDRLKMAFAAMDSLGAVAQPLAGLDQKIQNILNTAPTAKGMLQPPAELPSEEAVIHQVKTTTIMLEAISILTVVLLGIYILIWKNPGFGSVGQLHGGFILGTWLETRRISKLGPSDVRTAFGIKVPAAANSYFVEHRIVGNCFVYRDVAIGIACYSQALSSDCLNVMKTTSQYCRFIPKASPGLELWKEILDWVSGRRELRGLRSP